LSPTSFFFGFFFFFRIGQIVLQSLRPELSPSLSCLGECRRLASLSVPPRLDLGRADLSDQYFPRQRVSDHKRRFIAFLGQG